MLITNLSLYQIKNKPYLIRYNNCSQLCIMQQLRTIVFLSFIFCNSNALHAQWKGFSIGPYGELGFPAGDFQQKFRTGAGVGLTADIKLSQKLAATGSIGYMYFRGKEITDPNTGDKYKVLDLSATPIRAGLKYRAIPILYFKLEAGSAAYNGDNYDGSAFIFSPGVGLRVLGFDFQAKYEAWMKDGTKGFWGLKAGWNF